MRGLWKFSVTSLLLLIAGAAIAVQNDKLENPWLKVSGEQIVNQKGETIYLRGFGLQAECCTWKTSIAWLALRTNKQSGRDC